MTSQVSELIAHVLAFAAQLEWQSASERVTGARAYLRTAARYAGGWAPFGHRMVPNDDGNGLVIRGDAERDQHLHRQAAPPPKTSGAGRGRSLLSFFRTSLPIAGTNDVKGCRPCPAPGGPGTRTPGGLRCMQPGAQYEAASKNHRAMSSWGRARPPIHRLMIFPSRQCFSTSPSLA